MMNSILKEKTPSSVKKAPLPKWEVGTYAGGSRPSCYYSFEAQFSRECENLCETVMELSMMNLQLLKKITPFVLLFVMLIQL